MKGGFGVPCCNFNHSQAQGSDLVAAAAALSVWIGQGKTADELAILASLFDLMRSNLALMALNTVSDERPQGPGGQGENAGDITRQAILDAAAAGTP